MQPAGPWTLIWVTTQARPPHHQLLPTRVDEILSFQVLGSARPCALHLHPLQGLCVLTTQATAPMPSQAPRPKRGSAADVTSQSTSDIPASSELGRAGSLPVLFPCSWLLSPVPRTCLPPRTCCLLEPGPDPGPSVGIVPPAVLPGYREGTL